MRIRTIKPEFWMHEGLCHCSDFTRLLAIALLNWADDEGYFMANPILIRGQLFPFLDDSKKIPRSLQELSSVGWIELGKDAQQRSVGRVLNFSKHQRVDKPKPSEIKASSTFQDESKNDLGSVQDESKEERNGKERNGKEGNGKDGNGPILLSDESDGVAYSQFLESLWNGFPAMSRNRSSKAQLAKAWLGTKAKPAEALVLDRLRQWASSPMWTKDGGQFAQGAHIWIKGRKWESAPETSQNQNHAGTTENIPF